MKKLGLLKQEGETEKDKLAEDEEEDTLKPPKMGNKAKTIKFEDEDDLKEKLMNVSISDVSDESDID